MKKSYVFLMTLAVLLLALCLGACCAFADEMSGSCGNGVTYTLTGDDSAGYTLTISGSGAMEDYSAGSAPWNWCCDNIVSIEIENGVTRIGDYAFNYCQNSSLSSITLPDTVTSIGAYAFHQCLSLGTINLPDAVTSIGEYAFYQTNLTLISIPSRVTSIGDHCFDYCLMLSSVNFNSPAASIGSYAFSNCTNLNSIDIPGTVTSIGSGAFDSSLSEITFYDTTYVASDAIPSSCSITLYGSCGDNVTYTLEGKADDGYVLTIGGSGAMENYSSSTNLPWSDYSSKITSIVLSSDLTSIGDYAFQGFTGFSNTSVTIPSSVTSIGEYAFYNFGNLSGVTFEAGSQLTSIGANAFDGNGTLTTVTLPSGVTSIGQDAFDEEITKLYCSNPSNSLKQSAYASRIIVLSSTEGSSFTYALTADGTLTISGSGAMDDYDVSSAVPWKDKKSDITSVVISDGITSVGQYAFNGCTNLTSVSIAATVTSIGNYGFISCSRLSSISIPSSVETIGKQAFAYTALTNVTLPNSVTSIGEGAFDTATTLTCSNPSDGLKTSAYASRIIVLEGNCDVIATRPVTYVLTADGKLTISGTGEMREYSSQTAAPWYSKRAIITSVVINEGVEDIGSYAFKDCTGMTVINIPSTVTRIGGCAFQNCSSLSAITIPSGVKDILVQAFSGCSKLADITIPDSVEWISNNAFHKCTSLSSVSFGTNSKIEIIYGETFKDCTSLTSITIPAGVKEIYRSAFQGCTSLSSVLFAENSKISAIQDNAFMNCSSLTSITIPATVTSIGANSFDGCTKLSAVTLPLGATIGEDTFKRCSSDLVYTYTGSCGTGVTYALNASTGVMTISGTGAMTNYSPSSPAPWSSKASSITSVVINSGVRDVGDSSFRQLGSLTQVTLPDSVTSIGNEAFAWCSVLDKINIPSGVTSIGMYAFQDCDMLTSVVLPADATIGSGAFDNCSSNLTYTYAGKCGTGVTYSLNASTGKLSIDGTGAMADYTEASPAPWSSKASSITSVEIGSGVTGICINAFAETTKLYCSSPSEDLQKSAYASRIIVLEGDCSKTEASSVTYVLTAAGKLTISGSGAMSYYSMSTNAPWYGKRDTIKSIVIDNGVTTIGDYAFYQCTNMNDVTIADSVVKIESGAFSGCSSLESIIIPAGVTNIGSYAFNNCTSLAAVTQPYEVITGRYPFTNCSKSITFTYAGSCGENVNSVLTPDGTLTISGSGTMENYTESSPAPWSSKTSSITSVVIESGVTRISDYAFYGFPNLTGITIADSVMYIGCNAFQDCTSLTNVNFGENSVLDAISADAFHGCTNLTSIILPNSLTAIGFYAFYDCTNLAAVTLPAGAGIYNSFTSNPTFTYAGKCGTNVTYVLSNGTLTISGTGAMADYSYDNDNKDNYNPWRAGGVAKNVQNVVIENGVTSIGYAAIYGFSSLTSVTIADSVTSIGANNFVSTKLTSVIIPDSVKSIGEFAFCLNFELTTVTLPADATIGENAFDVCPTFTYAGKCGTNVNYVLTPDGTLTISGSGAMADYTAASPAPWDSKTSSITSVVVGENVTSIGSRAFAGCTDVTSVSIANINATIGENAFPASCAVTYTGTCGGTETSTVTFALNASTGKLTLSGSGAMTEYSAESPAPWDSKKSSITSVEIGSGVTGICIDAFADTTKFTCENPSAELQKADYASRIIVLEDSCGKSATFRLTADGTLTISGIGTMASYTAASPAPWNSKKAGITSVVIENGVTTIGKYAFDGCSSMTGVNIPYGMKNIGQYAFSGCSKLAEITIPASVESISSNAFSECTSLSSVNLGTNGALSDINAYAFNGCTSLTSITIPAGVKNIGQAAFNGCSKLTAVTLAADATIGDDAFTGCSSSLAFTYTGSCGNNVNYVLKDGTLTISGTGAMADYTAESPAPWDSKMEDVISAVIENGVTSIGAYAFDVFVASDYRARLSSVTISASVTSISDTAFNDCTAPMTIVLKGGSTQYNALKNALPANATILEATGSCGDNITYQLRADGTLIFTGSGNIPMDEYIWNSASANVTRVIIRSGITRIDMGVFKDCPMTSISIPNTVTRIDELAFSGCTNLTSIILPASVTNVAGNAFMDCTALKKVVLCGGLTQHQQLISMCAEVEDKIDYEHVSGSCGTGVTYVLTDEDHTLFISGTGAMKDYNSYEDIPWSLATSVEISSGVTRIGNYAFYNCSKLTDVSIPASVTSIGNYAFQGCTGLTSVTLPAGVTLGVNAFPENCTKIYTGSCGTGLSFRLNTGTGVLTISGSGAMDAYSETSPAPWNSYKSDITSVEIGENVTGIGSMAFAGCTGVTSVTIPNINATIGENAFPTSCAVTYTGTCGATTEKPVTFALNTSTGKLTISGSGAMADYTEASPAPWSSKAGGITSVEIGENVTGIGSRAFAGCTGVTSIALPAGVRSIGADAFAATTKLSCSNPSNDLKKSAYASRIIVLEGNCGGTEESPVIYELTAAGKLTISGSGAMVDYEYANRPWHNARNSILSIEIGSGVTQIGNTAFQLCESVTSVTINGSVTSIGDYAFNGCSLLRSITLPATVSSIGQHAFENCWFLSSITIPAGVSTINESVFIGCAALSSVQFAENSALTSILVSAFDGCKSLTGIVLPAGVTTLDKYAFASCSKLESITLPINATVAISAIPTDCAITYTGSCGANGNHVTFALNTGTGKLTISGSGKMADYTEESPAPWYSNYKDNVKSIVIDNGVTGIGNYAFRECMQLTEVTLPGSVTSIGDSAFRMCGSLTGIELPAGVTSIGSFAFSGCSKLTGITLPTGLKAIGNGTFESCQSLTSINIPAGVTSIGDNAFAECYDNYHKTGLSSVTFAEGSKLTTIGEHAFWYCKLLTGITLPGSVTSIGNEAFIDTGLTSVIIPINARYDERCCFPNGCTVTRAGSCGENVTFRLTNGTLTISGTGAMADYKDMSPAPWSSKASDITSVVIDSGVTSIGNYAFAYCTSLSGISIADSVTSIGYWAFNNCFELTSITIPAGVTSINQAFISCNKLIKIILQGGSTQYTNLSSALPENADVVIGSGSCGTSVTYELTADGKLTISGSGAMENYTSSQAAPWSKYSNVITSVRMDVNQTSVGSYAFYGCTNVESVSISMNATTIGQYAFAGCTSLSNVCIPEKVTSIGESAFSGCTGLTQVTCGRELETIAKSAFSGCTKLNYISIPDSAKSIGDYAFQNCSSLNAVGLSIDTTVGTNAFPSSCIIVYTGTCSKTILFSLENGKLSIRGTGAMTDYTEASPAPWYSKRTSITSIDFYGTVTSIGSYAFYGCSGLTSVTIPASVTSIGSYALGYQSTTEKIANFTIKGELGSAAMKYAYDNGFTFTADVDTSKMSTLTLPAAIKRIEAESFYGVAAEVIVIPAGCEAVAADAFTDCPNLKVIINHSSVELTLPWNIYVIKK